MAQVYYTYLYELGKNGGVSGSHLINDDIKVLLVDSNYVFDPTTQFRLDDIVDEVTGTGYTTGGVSLYNKALISDPDQGMSIYTADDTTWANSTITAYGAIVYRDSGVPSSSPLIAYFDFGGIKTTSNDTFKIEWNASGILNFT